MKCEKFELCVIVPFQYDKNWFEQMSENQNMNEYFEEKQMSFNRLDAKCQELWNKQEIMCCFEIRQKYRKELELHKNANYIYSFSKKPELLFSISKVNGWFMKTGEAFMTIRICAKDLYEEQMMDLKSMLTGFARNIKYNI